MCLCRRVAAPKRGRCSSAFTRRSLLALRLCMTACWTGCKLSHLKVSAQDAVFFGDTHADAGCAEAAGVRFVWFKSGFGTERVREFAQVLSFTQYSELAFAPA